MCEVRELRVPEFCRDLAYRQRSVEKSQNCSLPQERLTQFAKGGPLFAEAPLQRARGYRKLARRPADVRFSGIFFEQVPYFLGDRRVTSLIESSLQIGDGNPVRHRI